MYYDKLDSEAKYKYVSKMRASFLIMGPLLARTGKVKISLPGGCPIGSRPVDLHLKGFSKLGATIENKHGSIVAKAKILVGAHIYLDYPSVGATENIIMAACLAKGQTVIENCATEPEIVDLSNFLNKLGAEIKGAGTDTIKINGVKKLGETKHTIIPDRIEAGTFMIASAITKGDITIKNVLSEHVKPIIAKLREMNIDIIEQEDGLRVFCNREIVSTDIKTMPYPGFPTDMQAQFMSLLSVSNGTSIAIETIFENRFMHIGELNRLGANIKIDGRTAFIEGVKQLKGSELKATDLRAGAALALAALVADGSCVIENIHHIDRGYENFDEKLNLLGAKIIRQ